MSRFVDRGAIVAAFVGVGMAVTMAISFLLVIPIEPAYILLAFPGGLIIGYYANARSARARGQWRRILPNGLLAGLVTGLVLAMLLLGTKALFFFGDTGYPDFNRVENGVAVGPTCVAGADCVYHRYLAAAAGRARRGRRHRCRIVRRRLLGPAVVHRSPARARHGRRGAARRPAVRPRRAARRPTRTSERRRPGLSSSPADCSTWPESETPAEGSPRRRSSLQLGLARVRTTSSSRSPSPWRRLPSSPPASLPALPLPSPPAWTLPRRVLRGSERRRLLRPRPRRGRSC